MATAIKSKFWQRLLITGILASILLVVANSAFWINRNIFDTNNFTAISTAAITSDSSRQAIANEVVDRAFHDRPIIKEVAGPTAVKLVGSLLNTDQFNHLLNAAVSKLQVYLTSNQRESIVLNLSGVKNILSSLINLAGDTASDTQTQVNNLPDQIILVDANNIPSFYKYGLVFLWLGPITAIAAVALLAYPYLRDRSRYYIIAAAQGVMVIVVGLLCLLVGPLFKPPVLANIPSPNSRTVVSNLYDAFINTFNHQSLNLVKFGVALALIPAIVYFGLKFYSQRMAAKKKTT